MTSGHTPRVVVATHGHCFDGLCSAVMFTRLYRHRFPGDGAEFSYHGAGYGPGQNGVESKVLDGDVNVILDFRYAALPQLGWYFDHHVSAFPTPGDRADYDRRAADQEAAESADSSTTAPTAAPRSSSPILVATASAWTPVRARSSSAGRT